MEFCVPVEYADCRVPQRLDAAMAVVREQRHRFGLGEEGGLDSPMRAGSRSSEFWSKAELHKNTSALPETGEPLRRTLQILVLESSEGGWPTDSHGPVEVWSGS